jgi:hypothetical protein
MKINEFSKIEKDDRLSFNPEDDLTVFMRNDPMFYRKHYFPAMAKIADMQERGESIDPVVLMGPVIKQGIDTYCKKFNIKQRPDEIFPPSGRSDIIKKIYSEELPQIKKGDYRLKS